MGTLHYTSSINYDHFNIYPLIIYELINAWKETIKIRNHNEINTYLKQNAPQNEECQAKGLHYYITPHLDLI